MFNFRRILNLSYESDPFFIKIRNRILNLHAMFEKKDVELSPGKRTNISCSW